MSTTTRRSFIRASTAVGLSAIAYTKLARAATRDQRAVIGFIGCGGRSKSLLRGFNEAAEIAWACDPDEKRAKDFQQASGAKQVTSDLRRVLDDKSVDAIAIATPDHWHAPAAIMGCDAGKHVYVEKPCSHNLHEGRLLVEAARRNNVVVQHGTQSRTSPLVTGAIQMLREGLPSSASAIGGKYYFDDDQEFPDTATCAFQWPGDGSARQRKQLFFEMRIWSKNYPRNCDTGVEFYGTKGMLFVSKRGKLELWDDSNQPVGFSQDRFSEQSLGLPKNHQVDFLRAIAESRKPAADIAIGHDSVALIHLANISVRTGRALQVDPIKETINDDEAANKLLARDYRDGGHWSIPKGV